MLCWASWANTMKAAAGSQWRFELYYYDFSFGALLCATVAAFTAGSYGEGITTLDNLGIARKQQMGIAVLAGIVFNLGNMLLAAAISVAGMTVAIPTAMGMVLTAGTVANIWIRSGTPAPLVFANILAVVTATVLMAAAYTIHHDHKLLARLRQAAANPKSRAPAAPRPSNWRGLILSVSAGLLLTAFYPLAERARGGEGDIELAPYSIALLVAFGVFVSTQPFNLFFLNLPAQGQPLSPLLYFKGKLKQHLWGLLGGAIWCAGALASLLAFAGPESIRPAATLRDALSYGVVPISVLWGLAAWKEFAGAPSRSKMYLAIAIGLFGAGLVHSLFWPGSVS
jgi:glucose uptake protein